MSPTEIIEQCTDNGLTLTITDDGNLNVLGSQDWIDIWSPILRENKSAILAELDTSGKSCQRQNLPSSEPLQDLHPLEATPVQQPLNERSTDKYSVIVKDASTDPVLVKVTIKGLASFDLGIPQAYYDGIALLEVLERYALEQEQAA